MSIRWDFFFNDTATTEIYTLSLHDALPICLLRRLLSLQTFEPSLAFSHQTPTGSRGLAAAGGNDALATSGISAPARPAGRQRRLFSIGGRSRPCHARRSVTLTIRLRMPKRFPGPSGSSRAQTAAWKQSLRRKKILCGPLGRLSQSTGRGIKIGTAVTVPP